MLVIYIKHKKDQDQKKNWKKSIKKIKKKNWKKSIKKSKKIGQKKSNKSIKIEIKIDSSNPVS